MKVKIKDYQAIKDAELEFCNGITAIVGPTNSGKSSIIRAIEGAINNRAGNQFVNYDADKTVIDIEEDGNKVVWTKAKKGDSSYNINGNQLLKIGKSQLDEVGDLFNMSEIEVNDEKVRLNFWKQMSPPFLINKTSNQLFEFISKSKEQEIVAKIQYDKLADIKVLDKEIDTINTNIDSKTLDEKKYINILKELEVFREYDLVLLEGAYSLYKSIENLISYYDEQDKKSLASFKEYNYSSEVVEKLGKYDSTISETYVKFIEIMSLLGDFENKELFALEKKSSLDSALEKYEGIFKKYSSIESLVENIEETIKIIESVKDIILLYDSSLSNISSIKGSLDMYDRDVARLNEELSQFSVCPYCNQSLDGHNH